jgi:hypothetical protein
MAAYVMEPQKLAQPCAKNSQAGRPLSLRPLGHLPKQNRPQNYSLKPVARHCYAPTIVATINVPVDQPTIQAGINAAASGIDEVVVGLASVIRLHHFEGTRSSSKVSTSRGRPNF